jgi:hypothetical protein
MVANVEALTVTLGQLDKLGRLEDIDAAQVEALRSMAGALDLDPSNAALWGRYLGALDDLLGADDDADSGLASALKEIRGATSVGDTASS